jgi:hypothetical protein
VRVIRRLRRLKERPVFYGARVIDENVEPTFEPAAEDAIQRIDQRRHPFGLRQIGADCFGLPACVADRLDHRVCAARTRRIVDDDGCAIPRETGRDGGADAARRAGHECEFAFQSLRHDYLDSEF